MDKYHSVDKLRPIKTSADLALGVAIDKALNCLLLKTADPIEVFQNEFEWDKLPNTHWDTKDLQFELFTPEELHYLAEKPEEYLIYACLRRKGRVMIEAYIDYMLPKIKEVHSVQKELNNRPGVLDAILTIDGYGYVLADHKTSRQPYQNDAIKNDTQLALYASDQNIQTVAYIVLNKTLRFIKICTKCGADGSSGQHKTCSVEISGQRCHGAFQRQVDKSKIIQLICEKTPDLNIKNVTDSITQVEECINKSLYYKNLSACGNQYGKRCPYFNKCWNNNEDGLEYKKEEKK